jgi:hypothetical protein
MLDLRLSERTRKQRVTAVASDPPREILIEMVARGGGRTRTTVATLVVAFRDFDQAAREPSCWLVG